MNNVDPTVAGVAAAAEGILLVENAPLPLIVASPDGRISLANRAMRDLLGYETAAPIGQPIVDLLAEGPEAEGWWDDLLAAGATHEYPVQLRRRDGQAVPAGFSALVVTGEGGAAAWVVARATPV
ncbi:MAG: fold [Actinomycetota bacterium]|jgi:PAS domain S-box-containing protein